MKLSPPLTKNVNVYMQKVKTRVMKDNCNPEWDEELTLMVKDLNRTVMLVSNIFVLQACMLFFFFVLISC